MTNNISAAINKFLDDLCDARESFQSAMLTASLNHGIIDSEERDSLARAMKTLDTIYEQIAVRNEQ